MSSILCMQLLHWICVYCGCVSILNCETSQSDIYLTAKTAGEAEEDTGALSFKTRRMDSPRPVPAFAFFWLWECDSRTTGTADGTFGSIPTRCRLISGQRRSPGPRRTFANGTSAHARGGRGDSGAPHTFKGILVVNIL